MVSSRAISTFSVLSLASLATAAAVDQTKGTPKETTPKDTTPKGKNPDAKALPPPGKCKLIWDGRLPKGTKPTVLDAKNPYFSPDFTKGKAPNGKDPIPWSEIVKFTEQPSLFGTGPDKKATQESITVTINDKSIFQPKPDYKQTGFRRAELMAAPNTGKPEDGFTKGVRTMHFSIKRTKETDLNLAQHEYGLWWLENQHYSATQIQLSAGSLIDDRDKKPKPNPETLYIFGSDGDTDPKTNKKLPKKLLFKTEFTKDAIHNFGVTLDFVKNTAMIAYSKGTEPLAYKTKELPNNNTDNGNIHHGILKKAIVKTQADLDDLTKKGFQESPMTETLTFADIFVEDSTDKCVTLGVGTGSPKGGENKEVKTSKPNPKNQ